MMAAPILISGTVSDNRGRPVSGARVFITSGPGTFPDIAALTDAKGEFCISVLMEGSYSVKCSAEGLGQATALVQAKLGLLPHVALQLTARK
jgi:hypothetical protein